MNLSPEDLFILFNRACTVVGTQGYNGPWSKQTPTVVNVWTEFQDAVARNLSKLAPVAAPTAKSTSTEDAISNAVNSFEWDAQKIMYRLLYNKGHRINS